MGDDRDEIDEFNFTNNSSSAAVAKNRENRRQEISKLMSEALLKGHRMLNSSCPSCMNILMDDKQGRQYCIACELDQQAAVVVVDELKPNPPNQQIDNRSIGDRRVKIDDHSTSSSALIEAKSAIVAKLRSTTTELNDLDESKSNAACLDYANSIKIYAETLIAIESALRQ